jgi:hypothetical protein
VIVGKKTRPTALVSRFLFFFYQNVIPAISLVIFCEPRMHAICGSCAWFPLPGAYLSCDWLVITSYPISSSSSSLAIENQWQLSDVADFLNI